MLNDYIDEGYKETARVLKEKHKFIGEVYNKLLEFFSKYGKFDPAPVEILLFTKPYDTPVFSQAIKMSKDNEIETIAQDSVKTSTAMAMQNLLLIAHNEGLGTRVKDGVKFMINHDKLKKKFYREFNIPKWFILISGIQLGYPMSMELKKQASKRKPLEKIRRYA